MEEIKGENYHENLIWCKDCQVVEHMSCNNIQTTYPGYLCTICWFKRLDPYTLPIGIVCGPFIMKNEKKGEVEMKEFTINESLLKELKKYKEFN